MTPAHQGYMVGYIQKKADVLKGLGSLAGGVAHLGAEAIDKFGPVVLAAPPLLGAGLGYVHSKATAPSKLDAEAMQQAIELAELKEMQAAIKRKAELEQNQESRGVEGERSLRI